MLHINFDKIVHFCRQKILKVKWKNIYCYLLPLGGENKKYVGTTISCTMSMKLIPQKNIERKVEKYLKTNMKYCFLCVLCGENKKHIRGQQFRAL